MRVCICVASLLSVLVWWCFAIVSLMFASAKVLHFSVTAFSLFFLLLQFFSFDSAVHGEFILCNHPNTKHCYRNRAAAANQNRQHREIQSFNRAKRWLEIQFSVVVVCFSLLALGTFETKYGKATVGDVNERWDRFRNVSVCIVYTLFQFQCFRQQHRHDDSDLPILSSLNFIWVKTMNERDEIFIFGISECNDNAIESAG